MTFEAQIVLRRDSAQQLADDVRAVAEFIEQRKSSAPNLRPRSLRLVKTAERQGA